MVPGTPFERLEESWAALHRAFEDRVVAAHRGLPVDATYGARRAAFGQVLADLPRDSLSSEEQRGFSTIVGALGWFDEMEPVEETDAVTTEPPDVADLRRTTYDAYGEAAAAIGVGGETIDRLTAFGRLATEPDPDRRRAIFTAMEPVWRTVDGDGGRDSPYRRLLEVSAARWAEHGSPIETGASVLGIAPSGFEPMLHRVLAAGRSVVAAAAGIGDGALIEPWDYRYVVGETERLLRGAIPVDRLRPINDAHLRSLGADPGALTIGYDIFPRPGRPIIPVAFTIGGRPGPWVFASYREGGPGALGELLHESGHAIHEAAIDTRPAFAVPPPEHAAFFEAIAELVGWDAGEPAFVEHHFGVSIEPTVALVDRYGPVLLDVCWALFETELHRSPKRRPNDVWAEIVADGLGVTPHPEWSWWAVRGQLVESPGYLANYVLAAMAAAALRARIRDVRGDWSTGDRGWYRFVTERLLRFGAERPPADLLAEVLGGPLTEEPLLADLRRAL